MKPKTKEYSVVDPIKSGFDKAVIKNDKINPKVKEKILKATDIISKELDYEIDKIWILGSTLTYQWKKNSDIDVTIFLKDKLDSDDYKELNKIALEKYNDKLYINEHPINFYFSPQRFLKFKADAIYDLKNDKWIKKSEPLNEDEIEDLIRNCSSLEEFNTIFQEYLELKDMLENFVGESDQLNEIISKAMKISNLYSKIKDIRREDFKKKPDPDIPSANYRCSNVIFKMLESYGLGDIAEEISNFIESRFKD